MKKQNIKVPTIDLEKRLVMLQFLEIIPLIAIV